MSSEATATKSQAPAWYWQGYIRSGGTLTAITGETTFAADVDLTYNDGGTDYWPSAVIGYTAGVVVLKNRNGETKPVRLVAGQQVAICGVSELTFTGTTCDGLLFLYNDDR